MAVRNAAVRNAYELRRKINRAGVGRIGPSHHRFIGKSGNRMSSLAKQGRVLLKRSTDEPVARSPQCRSTLPLRITVLEGVSGLGWSSAVTKISKSL